MHIQGTITEFMPEVSGVSKAGNNWQKGGIVIETGGDYPKTIAFSAFNERLQEVSSFEIGAKVNVEFRAESRKWEGKDGVARWRTDLSIINIEPVAPAQPVAPASVEPIPTTGSLPF